MINWADKDSDLVERAIKMRLRQLFPDITSIDGSGGDDARDLARRTDDGLTVFEVKSFTRALVPSQRRQVEKSLKKAVRKHSPETWVLIIPKDRTPAELVWFEALAEANTAVSLEWWGRDWLDGAFADRQDLIAAIEGPDYQVLARAREMRMEDAVLANGASDLIARANNLMARADELSPHWRYDLTIFGGLPTLILAEKYPGAAVQDPITVTPTFQFPSEDPVAQEVASKLRHTLGFGGDVTVPGAYIAAFEVEASIETRRMLGPTPDDTGELRITSVADQRGLPLSLQCRLQTRSGRVKHSVEFRLDRRVGGSLGFTLSGTDSTGLLEIQLQVPHDRSTPTLNITALPSAGRFAHEVLPALQFMTDHNASDRIVFWIGPQRLGIAHVNAQALRDSNLQSLARYVDALVVISEARSTPIRIPAEISSSDARDVLDLALVFRGEKASRPYRSLDLTVKATHIGEFLQKIPAGDQGALWATQGLAIEIGDTMVELGTIAVWAPATTLINRPELLAAAKEGRDCKAIFERQAGTHIYWSPQPKEDTK